MLRLRYIMPKIERTLLYKHDLVAIQEADVDASTTITQLPAPMLDLLRKVGPIELTEMRLRLARGDRCYVAYQYDGQIAHYSWVQLVGRHHAEPAGVWYEIGELEAWIYDCRTEERQRGKHIYPKVLARILTDLKSARIRTAYIYTTRSNTPSQHGIERTGFVLTRQLLSIRVGSKARLISQAAEESADEPYLKEESTLY